MEHIELIQTLYKAGLDRNIITKWTDEKLEDKYNKLVERKIIKKGGSDERKD